MEKAFQAIIELLEKGEDVVLTTVIAESGSTPRGVGSRMWVSSNGRTGGTIGGGMVEYKASLKAVEALEKKISISQEYNLGPNDVASIGMICGGAVVVYCQYISHEDKKAIDLLKQIEIALQRDEAAWLIFDITEDSALEMSLYSKNLGLLGTDIPEVKALLKNKAGKITEEGRTYYVEPIKKAGIVYVFGGGHVSQELVPVLTHLDFKCVVFDDRAEFSNPERFPTAAKTYVGDFKNIGDYVDIGKDDYVVVVTKGHKGDLVAQAHALTKNPAYIGIMGSKTKLGRNAEILMEKGFTKEQIEKCHMPIGTAIKAETPEELAISIAGELIMVRASRGLEV